MAADDVTRESLAHSGARFEPIRSDDDATFLKSFSFDVDGMGPQVACPSNPANLKPVEDVAGAKSDAAFPGSRANAPIEGPRIAARLPRGGEGGPRRRSPLPAPTPVPPPPPPQGGPPGSALG